MDESIFKQFLSDSIAFFERKPPPVQTVALWYSEVNAIPQEALLYITERLRELEAFPRNLPAFMWGARKAWKKFTPAQAGKDGGHECRDGFWEVAQYVPGLGKWAIHRFSCSCRGGAIKSRLDLLDQEQYERGPERYQEAPSPWMLIYPDAAGMKVVKGRIYGHLDGLRRKRGLPEGGEIELPF